MKKNKAINKSLRTSAILCISYLITCIFFNLDYRFEFLFLLVLINYLYIRLYSFDYVDQSYRQTEILIPIINDLNINKKLPNTRGYAASPDYLYEIKEIIKEKKPKIILETGSGVSTIIAAYALKKYGNGKIISLDHDEKYANFTKEEIKKHGLEEYVEVLYAPLKKYFVSESESQNNIELMWYDLKNLNIIKGIDLFIIDGPPKGKIKNARYPALKLMFNKINNGATILLDDARRKNEQETIKLWKKEYSNLEFTYIDNDKGIAKIKKIDD